MRTDPTHQAVLGLIFFTLEQRNTPASAIPVPVKIRNVNAKLLFLIQIYIKKHNPKKKNILQKRDNELPRELMGETGVLKKRTEVTMTTTRFTQLPTEWVTGDTFDSIIYDTYFTCSSHKTILGARCSCLLQNINSFLFKIVKI